MTAQARHIVFRTSKADATPADVERWAAERGCIVCNVRQIPTTSYIEFEAHIACILANGSVYFPEGFDVADMTDFRNAEATGRFWPLVRGEWRGDPVPVLHRETKPDKSIQQERSAGMSNLLRDRIAAVLADEFKRQGYACEWAVLADAVISVVSDEYINSRGMFHEPDRCLGCEECND